MLNKVVTEHTFQGWQVQPCVHATIKRNIILELVRYAKAYPEGGLSPDDYSIGVSFRKAEEVVHAKAGWIQRHLYRMKQYEKENKAIADTSMDIETAKAKRRLTIRLKQLAEKHGFTYNRVSIRNQKTRWGSCSHQNNINLNMKLVKLPDELE